MMDRFIFLSSDEFAAGQFVPRQMVEDLLAIAEAPAERLERLSNALKAESGFLSKQRLEEVVKEALGSQFSESAVVRTLYSLEPDDIQQTLARLEAWRNASEKNADQLPAEAMADLGRKLPILIRRYHALRRQQKAQRLEHITGNEVLELEIICDSRPIFDENRERIEGMIPLTGLKIVYERQDGSRGTLELTIPEKSLDDLLEKATKAKNKLTSLRKFIKDSIPGGLAGGS